MSFKEKLMEEMMNKMSPEERKEMMAKMMESFFSVFGCKTRVSFFGKSSIKNGADHLLIVNNEYSIFQKVSLFIRSYYSKRR